MYTELHQTRRGARLQHIHIHAEEPMGEGHTKEGLQPIDSRREYVLVSHAASGSMKLSVHTYT